MTTERAATTQQSRPRDSLLSALGDELMRMSRRRHRAVPDTRLDASAYRLLWALADGEPRTLRDLSSELGLDLSTINRQVNAAVRAGLLERFTVPGSPSRPVRPTREGARLYAHDTAVHADLLRSVLAEMGPEAAEELIRGLRAFNDAYERRAPRRP